MQPQIRDAAVRRAIEAVETARTPEERLAAQAELRMVMGSDADLRELLYADGPEPEAA